MGGSRFTSIPGLPSLSNREIGSRASPTMGKKKFLNQTDMKIGVIGDEDTVTGMVLAGIGHVDGQGKKNFLLVDAKTHRKDMGEKFQELTNRKDISMVFITQSCADMIRD